ARGVRRRGRRLPAAADVLRQRDRVRPHRRRRAGRGHRRDAARARARPPGRLGRAHRRAPLRAVGRRADGHRGPRRPPAAGRAARRAARRAPGPPARRDGPVTGWTTRPRVWAPEARRVDLHLPSDAADDVVHAMSPADGGWWDAPVGLPHGTDYWFAVDGGPPRPDPRSPWQPHGVHGPSRTFDPTAHAWADAGWAGRDVRGAVLY